MADGNTGLGELITTEKGRDAVYVAIAPVTAAEKLYPGQGIVLTDATGIRVKSATGNDWSGIVDPFLTAPVFPEQRFWMWMRPGSITSLRHEWTHPALDSAPALVDSKAAARSAVAALGASMGMTFDGIMDAARTYQESGRQLVRWEFEGMGIPNDFWDDYQTLTGEKLKDRDTFFHCGGCS